MKKHTIITLAAIFILSMSVVSFAGQYETKMPEKKAMNIVETAVAAGSFNTLVTAVKTAGLVDALSGEGPFTVFAPTDAAFEMLPKGTVEALLKDKEKLSAILTYHIVSGKVMSSDVAKLKTAKTLNGQEVSIKSDDKNVMIDNARVVQTDIECSNGVIHVIDAVILPSMEKAEK
ncbi:MAG: Nex18 symbiotically induced protein [candidate division Zixibacteria bacterium HGW-Zixibacteria-1]|nr:MAG: Nex18 symbiotically induced protein [candidate division Zixibacteria bacterium HGW-Zixibacteria-1]